MSTLAGLLEFDTPPAQFLNSIPHLSLPAKTLLWYGLAPDTRRDYNMAIHFYEFFCASRGISPWLATAVNLIEWVITRAFRLAILNPGQI